MGAFGATSSRPVKVVLNRRGLFQRRYLPWCEGGSRVGMECVNTAGSQWQVPNTAGRRVVEKAVKRTADTKKGNFRASSQHQPQRVVGPSSEEPPDRRWIFLLTQVSGRRVGCERATEQGGQQGSGGLSRSGAFLVRFGNADDRGPCAQAPHLITYSN